MATWSVLMCVKETDSTCVRELNGLTETRVLGMRLKERI